MDLGVCLPSYYCRWERGGWFLYFDPNNFVWVRVNKEGAEIIESFRRYKKVSEVVTEISNVYNLKKEEIEESIVNFVSKMIDIGFLHKDIYCKKRVKISFPSYPKVLYLNVTNRCNLNCVYCYNRKDRISFKDSYEMSITEYSKILKESAELGVKRVVLTGGEPTLYSGFLEVARIAKEQGINTELLTNGVMINNSNAEKIAKTFDAITISLDSHKKEEHEAQRGKGTYEKVIDAIKILKSETPRLNIATVVTTKNINSMIEFHAFALEELQANRIIVQLYIPYSTPSFGAQRDLIPSFEKIVDMEEKIKKYIQNRTGKETAYPILGRRINCGAATGEIGVAPNGDVFPCHALHKKEFICGNLRRQNLKEILEKSKTIKFFRNLIVYKIDKCKKCDLRYLCGGGCRAMAYIITGKIDGYNKLFCKYLKYDSINKLWESSTMPLKEVQNFDQYL